MTWWAGNGAVKWLRQDSNAILLERLISNQPAFVERVKNGDDEEATCIICSVALKLHSVKKKPWPRVVPLNCLFLDLEKAARNQGGIFLTSWEYAQEVILDRNEITILHDDLYHGNILYIPQGEWLAIAPKV